MSTPEERLRMAFDAVKVPGDLRQRTLAQIERNRPAVRPRQRQRLVWRLAAAAAAVLVIALLGWGGHSVYAAETAVVGIELNPALELGLNRFNIVVNARALNLEGEAVLSSVNVLGKSYDQAWDLVTTCPAFQSFLGEESFIDA
ncbi:MAG: hypothetical protein FWC59_00530, partial [Actinomycetia bacterium]|nr:hypothetical protein [Actinomycetes bacterium]